MSNRISYYLLLFFAPAFLWANKAPAQVTTQDTITVVADGEEEEESSEDEASYYPDTLRRNYRSVVYDTILAINADKGFYYKRYMDSLLRAYQLRLKKAAERNRLDSLRRDSLIRAGKIRPDASERRVIVDGSGILNSAVGILFLVIAFALVAFIVVKLFLGNSQFFSRNRKNISVDFETSTEDDDTDPERMLRNAIRNGDYRLAVRYLYLQSLELLSQRKFIEINSNKTNYEYVTELKKRSFANEFASLTLQYEYIWYGEYPIDARLFEYIHDGFTRFNKMIR